MTADQIRVTLKACMWDRELMEEGGIISEEKAEDVDKKAVELRNLNGAIVELLVAIGKSSDE